VVPSKLSQTNKYPYGGHKTWDKLYRLRFESRGKVSWIGSNQGSITWGVWLVFALRACSYFKSLLKIYNGGNYTLCIRNIELPVEQAKGKNEIVPLTCLI
jgi:hypothetical protein